MRDGPNRISHEASELSILGSLSDQYDAMVLECLLYHKASTDAVTVYMAASKTMETLGRKRYNLINVTELDKRTSIEGIRLRIAKMNLDISTITQKRMGIVVGDKFDLQYDQSDFTFILTKLPKDTPVYSRQLIDGGKTSSTSYIHIASPQAVFGKLGIVKDVALMEWKVVEPGVFEIKVPHDCVDMQKGKELAEVYRLRKNENDRRYNEKKERLEALSKK